MKSRPIYEMLSLKEPRTGHVFVSCDHGAMAVKRTLDSTVWSAMTIQVLHAKGPDSDSYTSLLDGLSGLPVEIIDSPDNLLPIVAGVAKQASAGTQFYLAGSEVFLWKVYRILREAGLARAQISMELLGSKARRVSCVHCKTMNEGVTTNPHRCVGCGQWLLVRDHFSRLMGAYVGVRIDAEEHGVVPEPEEVFS